MIEDIRDWVMARDTPLRLMWHGCGILEFSDELHFYRMLEDTHRVSVAPIEGFERWGPSTTYYMEQLPYSKESLMRLVGICRHLTENIEVPEGEELRGSRTVKLGPLDIGPVYEIDPTGLSRMEVLQVVGQHLFTEVRSWVLRKGPGTGPDCSYRCWAALQHWKEGEVTLQNIEPLVDIVMGPPPKDFHNG